MIGYILLGGAIVCEVFATTMMKVSAGFSLLAPSIACAAGYLLCFFLLGKALLTINLSVAYAVWAALGILLTSAIAVVAFGDHLTLPAIGGMVLIVTGVIVLNLFGPAH